MTLQEKAALLGGKGEWETRDIPRLGIPSMVCSDGPSGLRRQAGTGDHLGLNPSLPATCFPCPSLMACSWDQELEEAIGAALGEEAADQGVDILLGPGLNIKRNPLCGRNFEYYSEDPLISGHMGGLVVRGSLDMGVYCYVKHLICNDQESGIYRDGIYTWMTEQTLRELYLKPFQMLVQDYGATGFMTAYNRIGAVWAGGSQALLTGILKEEWGFHGAIVTDYADHHKYMNGDQALRAGGSLWMDGILNDGKFRFLTEENEAFYYHALRRTSKEVLYMYLNARAENREYSQRMGDPGLLKPVIYPAFPLWGAALGAFDLMAASAFLFCLRRTKKPEKKKKRRE